MNKCPGYILTLISCFLLLCSTTANAVIPVMYVPMLTSEQTNPVQAGVLQSQQIMLNQMQIAQQYQRYLQMKQEREQEQVENVNNPVKIMVFSQNKYPTYLGCFNCAYYTKESIHNDGGPFGSRYAEKSIYNPQGTYGSHYSKLSACNPQASHPPIIVDSNGTIYGLLTLNTALPNAIRDPFVLKWLKNHVCS